MDKIMYSLNNEKLLNITQSNTTPKSSFRLRFLQIYFAD
jgi:hypothetical protein